MFVTHSEKENGESGKEGERRERERKGWTKEEGQREMKNNR